MDATPSLPSSSSGGADIDGGEALAIELAMERANWERERTHLRARIGALLAENKALRLQIGQIHAEALGVPTGEASRGRRSQQ